MDVQHFISTERKILCELTSKILDEEDKKTTFWRIHDQIDSDIACDNEISHFHQIETMQMKIPEVSELPKAFSFKGYQEFCMRNGLETLDIQQELDEYFRTSRIIKRWFLYFHYAPFAYLTLFVFFLICLGA